MMAIRLPERLQHRDPRQLMEEWVTRRRFVAPVMAVDGMLWARISTQAYNVPEDYERFLGLAR
jgi:hypothetical protein